MLVDNFTVVENIILGMETTKKLGIIDIKEGYKEVEELSKKYGSLSILMLKLKIFQ